MIPDCDGQTVGRSDGQTVRRTESIMAKTALCIASYADALSKISACFFDSHCIFGDYAFVANHVLYVMVSCVTIDYHKT